MREAVSTKELLCPIRYALDIVGGKWKLPIICLLASGEPKRNGAIKRKLQGITNMMLSQSLKDLEAAGILERRQYNEVPPRVEYSLTQNGKDLLPALQMLALWGVTQMPEGCEAGAYCQDCQESVGA